MKISQCTLCGTNLTSANNSQEHIIPNAIGGRKKVTGFICTDCNSRSGSEWDDELARQLNPICLLLGISRQRGDVRSQTFPTYSGNQLRMNSDGTLELGRPRVDISSEGTATKLHFQARTRKELKQQVEGQRRKYLQIQGKDADALLSTAQDSRYYNSDPMGIELCFGGLNCGRALVKSALALLFDAGIDPRQCDLALTYLLDESSEPCFGYYYDRADVVINRPRWLPFHCVYVKGCNGTSSIVGYIELFGFRRIVLCLSESYTGEDFEHTYAIDPIKGQEIDVQVNFGLSLSEIHKAYEYERFDEAVAIDAIARVLDKSQEIGFDREMGRVVRKSVESALSKLGLKEGDVLDDEQIARLSGDIIEGLMPFIIHQMTLNDGLMRIMRQEESSPFPDSFPTHQGPSTERSDDC